MPLLQYVTTKSALLSLTETASIRQVDGNRVSKRPTPSRGEGEMTKRVALGIVELNARQSPRSKKGNNSPYDHSEWLF